MGLGPSDRLLGVFPFFHVAGFGLALSTLTTGGTVARSHPGGPPSRAELTSPEV